jgi:hypothetical protein
MNILKNEKLNYLQTVKIDSSTNIQAKYTTELISFEIQCFNR